MTVAASSEFKGIGFDFDSSKNPFFKALVKENLRKLAALPTGKALLKAIADARPEFRRKGLPKSVNVVLKPPYEKVLLAPGMKLSGVIADQAKYDAWRNDTIGVKLVPTLPSKTSVAADCGKGQGAPKYPKPNGTGMGSTCYIEYSNIEIRGDDGLWAIPHITMGHELIHCLHALRGLSKFDDKHEEWCTVGIKGYEGEVFCENALRAEGNFPLRKKYFKDD
jgi:hypothetical protein